MIREIPLAATEARVETGPVQFGDDWPGIFIRGDDAWWLLVPILRLAKDAPIGVANPAAAEGLLADIREATGRPLWGDPKETDAPAE